MVLEINGIELHYEIIGEGEPLLWLHGFMGAGSDWTYIFRRPPAGYRLIAPDLRGHGASTSLPGAYTFRESAGDVAALLQHLRLDSVKAIGLSGGGITLLHLATATPSLITSMVLISTPPYFPEQARAIQRQASEAMLSELEMQLMRQRHTHGARQIDQLFASARVLADTYDDVSFTPPSLSTITADTLIVFGDRDPLYPVSLALDLHQGIRGSHLWVIPNGGHSPVFGDGAERFSETALAFLRGEGQFKAGQ